KARDAAEALAGDGVAARVVSMPWRERFTGLPDERRAALLPPGVPRVVVEAGVPQGWEGIAGPTGRILGLDRFGGSAPGEVAMEQLGFTPDNIAVAAGELLDRKEGSAS
ncbi:MAG TPA: hypothetical protein VG452_12395, partial [Egibacteraceae bacterium]|nr:hypothetical protein [Egibacteraceae bacterium]